MQIKHITLLLLAISFLQSCSNSKNIYWVGGQKTDCVIGAGKTQCLQISKGNSIDNPKWENFSSEIEGFNFEEGYLKKIKVKETKVAKEDIAADASSIEYKLVKELDKQKDSRLELGGKWNLNTLNNNKINKNIPQVIIEFKINEMRFNGYTGCNNFFGKIDTLGLKRMFLSDLISTKRACIKANIENEFLANLADSRNYEIKNDTLFLYDQGGKEILSFLKNKDVIINKQLNDIWVNTRINEDYIDRVDAAIQRLEIHLEERKIMGDDGCNEFVGKIDTLTENQISFELIASTRKKCSNMYITEAYNQALQKVRFYSLEGRNLIFKDSEGNEVLAYIKVD